MPNYKSMQKEIHFSFIIYHLKHNVVPLSNLASNIFCRANLKQITNKNQNFTGPVNESSFIDLGYSLLVTVSQLL